MFDPKIACMTLPYSELPFSRAVEGIARAGYRYLAFGTTHEGIETPGSYDDDARIGELGRIVRDAGLEPVMMFQPRAIALTAEGGQDLFRRRIDQAKLMGVPQILVIGPWEYKSWPDEKHPADVWARMTDEWFEAVAPVVKYAEEMDVMLVSKPHTGITATASRCREAVERVGSTHFRICYDGGNVHFYEGVDPAEDIRLCADITVALCIKDHVGPRANPLFPYIGEGDVDHESMLRTLSEFGFSGPCPVERFEGPNKKAEMSPELIDSLAAKALETVQAMVDRIRSGQS
ncbi:MAG: sugar phosphate isomerase/epimerase [Armatimonadetes bacterium]|nr:sugar phosphate isomerase/epimerase [Armatimonadota bacterium]